MTEQQGMNRRNFVLAATATASTVAASMKHANAEPRNYGPGAPPVRYPDPNIVVIDDAFKSYKLGNAAIMRNHCVQYNAIAIQLLTSML